jgi:paraquat-inducible protein A
MSVSSAIARSAPAQAARSGGGRLIECPDCGLVQRLPGIGPGASAACPRCDAVLWRPRRNSLPWSRALALTGLILYTIALGLPFMGFDMYGRGRQTNLVSAADAFASGGAWELAIVLAATIILLPIAKLLVLLVVSGGLALRHPPRWLYLPFRWYEKLTPWAMIDVYLIGVFVAYTKLSGMAHVDIGPAAYALAGLMLVSVTADATLDTEAVWEAIEERNLTHAAAHPSERRAGRTGRLRIGCPCCDRLNLVADEGEPCPRCGTAQHRRKPASVARSWALVIAAMIFYVPANLFPILDLQSLGRGQPATILEGVQELIASDMIPIAILVFVASFTVPTLKLVAMMIMLASVHRGWTGRLRDRTRLYRIVDVIGRWSMIDVFMLSVLVSLVQLGFVATVRPEIGAVCFAAVVVLTMLAAASFDPRLMWDAAEASERRRGAS